MSGNGDAQEFMFIDPTELSMENLTDFDMMWMNIHNGTTALVSATFTALASSLLF